MLRLNVPVSKADFVRKRLQRLRFGLRDPSQLQESILFVPGIQYQTTIHGAARFYSIPHLIHAQSTHCNKRQPRAIYARDKEPPLLLDLL